MIRIDPDVVDPRKMVDRLREIEAEVGDAADEHLATRMIEIPVFFEDEWTHETLMRFRDRHQTPDKTDIEFAAERNGYDSSQAFIDAICGAPFIVSMTGFVPDLAWDYQLVPEERQIEVPKYARPRTDTPALAFSWGGAFAAIYPVQGAGGYQLLGICPVPVIDLSQTLPDFKENPFLHRAGDLHRYRPIDREEYDAIRAKVGEGVLLLRDGGRRVRPREVLRGPGGHVRRAHGAGDMSLRVVKGGLLTTVQDEGRTGVYHLGMPPSGAMDKFSYRVANMLVGNQPGAAALEITYMGPQLEVTADTVFAVTGADMPASVNGEAVESWTSHAVKAGDVIAFEYLRSGARAYVGLAGGVDVPEIFGSRATYTLVGMGGFEGRGLAEGDELAVLPDGDGTPGRSVPEDLRPVFTKETELRLVVGLSALPAAARQPGRVLRDDVAGDAGRQPHRLPLPRRRAALRRPHAAARGGQRPGQRDRHRLPHRLDPGAGRRRADRAAGRRRHRRRVRDDRDHHLGRPGPRRAEQDERLHALRRGGPRRCAAGTPRGRGAPGARPRGHRRGMTITRED